MSLIHNKHRVDPPQACVNGVIIVMIEIQSDNRLGKMYLLFSS